MQSRGTVSRLGTVLAWPVLSDIFMIHRSSENRKRKERRETKTGAFHSHHRSPRGTHWASVCMRSVSRAKGVRRRKIESRLCKECDQVLSYTWEYMQSRADMHRTPCTALVTYRFPIESRREGQIHGSGTGGLALDRSGLFSSPPPLHSPSSPPFNPFPCIHLTIRVNFHLYLNRFQSAHTCRKSDETPFECTRLSIESLIAFAFLHFCRCIALGVRYLVALPITAPTSDCQNPATPFFFIRTIFPLCDRETLEKAKKKKIQFF